MIKLIASDMDGTLLNDNHEIDKETVEAIKRAEEAGIIFAISTGREYENVKCLLEENNIKCQCILSNGAEYRDEDGNILEVINIEKEKAKKILNIFKENAMSARIFTSEGVFTTSTREEALQEVTYRTMTFNSDLTEEEAREKAKQERFFTTLKYVDDVESFFNSEIEIRKFVAFHSDIDLIKKVKQDIGKLGQLEISSSFYDNIEVTDIRATKGSILEKVAKEMGLKNDNIMVLGDSFNDYSMFEIFKESVAMENAIPEIKASAKYITDANYNLGVAKAINCVINNQLESILKKV